MHGRKPTPTYLKLLRGNPGKQRLPANEPHPAMPANIPEAPVFLDGYAREEWNRIAGELYNLNLLTVVDINPLGAYCVAYSQWRSAVELLALLAKDRAGAGMLIKTKDGSWRRNPVLNVARDAALDMLRFAAEFGLTPSARARIDAGPDGARLGGRGGKFDGFVS